MEWIIAASITALLAGHPTLTEDACLEFAKSDGFLGEVKEFAIEHVKGMDGAQVDITVKCEPHAPGTPA